MAKKDPSKSKTPTRQVRISTEVFFKLDRYASSQSEKLGRRVELQEIATAAVEEYLNNLKTKRA